MATTAYNRIGAVNVTHVKNSDGKAVFQITPLQRLERFLILGSAAGTYYVDADTLTDQNVKNVVECLDTLGVKAVELIVDVSMKGRNVKQEPVLLALALAAAHTSEDVRKAALAALPKVARTGTMLYQFNGFVEKFRGRGSALNRAVRNWVTDDVERTAFQAVKYQSRDGWSFADVLRLTKPKPQTEAESALYGWAVGKPYSFEALPKVVQGFEVAKRAKNSGQVISAITQYGLPWEAVPTQFLKDPNVWEALLPNIGLTAVIRNLRRFNEIGLTTTTSAATKEIVRKLTDPGYVRASRIHPYAVLVAFAANRGGVAPIVTALDKAFYLAFDNVEPTGKRTFIGLDISGSMNSPVLATPSKRGAAFDWSRRGSWVTCRQASAAMALVTMRAESDAVDVFGFDTGLRRIPMTSSQRLDDAIKCAGEWGGGATDCSLAIEHALRTRTPYDVFVVYTDSETNSNRRNVDTVLDQYRREVVPGAKLVVVGMTSTGFSIGDPKDPGVLNVAGFDTAAPKAIAEFTRS